MKKKLIAVSVLTAISSLMVGCVTPHTKKWNEVESQVQDNIKDYEILKNRVTPSKPEISNIINDFYIDKSSIDLMKDTKSNLPSVFYTNVSFMFEDPILIKDLKTIIFSEVGLYVDIIESQIEEEDLEGADEVIVGDNFQQPQLPLIDQFGNPMVMPVDDPTMNSGNMFIETGEAAETKDSIFIDYEGDVRGLFDYIAMKKDLKWKYDNEVNKVYFYEYNTETFTVFALSESVNSSSSITTNVSSNSSSETGQGSADTTNQQTISYQNNQDYWKEVSDNIKEMISDKGFVSINSTQGKITVTDNDFVIAKVSKYINDLNEEAYKQISFDFKVINIKVSEERNIGVNLNTINDRINLSLGTALAGVTNSQNSLAYSRNDDTLLLNILDEYGTVNVTTDLSTTTMNNMPVPVQVATNQVYVKEIRSENLGEDGDNTVYETVTDTVSDGVTIILTPKVIGNRILLNYTMNLSVIDDLVQAPGNSQVQLPLTSTKNFVQRLTLRNGETRIVAAFQKQDTKAGSKHPLSRKLWMFGGNETFDNQKEIVLIAITPYAYTLK